MQIVEEATGELVYAVRIKGGTFAPKVFKKGSYTVQVGEGAGRNTLKGVKTVAERDAGELRVSL